MSTSPTREPEVACRVGDAVDRLGVSPDTLTTISRGGMLRKVAGGYSEHDVATLQRQRKRVYLPWNPGDELYFGVATTYRGGYGSGLYLSPGNDRDEAEELLGGDLDSRYITGWWPCRDDMFTMLTEQHIVILGLTGGYVREAARIERGVRRPDRDCAFLVQPLVGGELEEVRGFTPPPIGHRVTYLTPQR